MYVFANWDVGKTHRDSTVCRLSALGAVLAAFFILFKEADEIDRSRFKSGFSSLLIPKHLLKMRRVARGVSEQLQEYQR